MKRTVLQVLGLVAVAAALVLIPACGGGGGSGGKVKVAIVTNCVDPFWDICQAGAIKGGKDFDLDVVFKQPEQSTVDFQMKTVDDLTKLGLKGLAVSVKKPKEQTAKLKAVAAELPLNNFITIDSDAPDTGRLCYVGVDNYEAGKEVGRMVKEAVPGGGTVALFIGNTDQDNSQRRIAGVLSELAGEDVRAEVAKGQYREKYGEYTLHEKQPKTDQEKKDQAAANAADAMESLKNTPKVCYVGLYSYNPAKIYEAALKKEMIDKIKIVGFDEDVTTLDGIAKGHIHGSVSQDPYNYGFETVKWLRHVIDGKDKKDLPQDPTPFSVVTKDGGGDVTRTVDVGGSKKEIKVKQRKATEYAQLVRDAYTAAKAGK